MRCDSKLVFFRFSEIWLEDRNITIGWVAAKIDAHDTTLTTFGIVVRVLILDGQIHDLHSLVSRHLPVNRKNEEDFNPVSVV